MIGTFDFWQIANQAVALVPSHPISEHIAKLPQVIFVCLHSVSNLQTTVVPVPSFWLSPTFCIVNRCWLSPFCAFLSSPQDQQRPAAAPPWRNLGMRSWHLVVTWWQNPGSLSWAPLERRTWTPRHTHRHAGNQWNSWTQERRRHLFLPPDDTREHMCLQLLYVTLLRMAFLHLVMPITMMLESGASRAPRRKRAKACSNLGSKWESHCKYQTPGKCCTKILPWQRLLSNGRCPEENV